MAMSGDSIQTRQYLKHQHKCRECRGIDAYTMNGRTHCAECAEKIAERARKAREKDPKKYAEMQKGIRDKRREEGKCTRCGRELPYQYSFKTCPLCRIYGRNRLRNIRADTDKNVRGYNGICYQCNKEPAIEGKKLCRSCYSMKMHYLEKAMEVNRMRKDEAQVKQSQRRWE